MKKKLNAKNTIKKKYGEKWKLNDSLSPEERNKILESMLFPDEYLGEEFPKIDKENSYCPPFEISFDIRIIPYKNGTVELCYKTKDAYKYKKVPFDGLTPEQASDSFNLFCQEIVFYLMNTTHNLYLACKERQNENLSDRREFLNEWINTLSIHYRKILGLGYEELIETSEENGVEQEIWRFVDVGKPKQTKEEKEKKRRKFIDDVFDALKQIEEENGKMTRINVGSILFRDEIEKNEDLDIPSRMKYYLNQYSLDFDHLVASYNSKLAVK